MKTNMKKIVFYFIALVACLIWAYSTRDLSLNDKHLGVFVMSFIPIALIGFYVVRFFVKK